jgi:hypothetical protein
MPANEYTPVFQPGENPSGKCTAAVTGKRLVASSADIPGGLFGTENIQIAHCGAGAKPIGVAGYDGAIGDTIPIFRNGVGPLTAGAVNLAANTPLMSDAQGRVVLWTTGNHCIGVSVSASVNVGDDIGVALSIG